MATSGSTATETTETTETGHPLILVFYLDAEMLKIPEIIGPFSESVNQMFIMKKANAMAFFLPTTGQERVECINPTVVAEADMVKINTMIEDIRATFMVDVDVAEGEDIITDAESEEVTPETKECACGGDCKCNKED